MNRTRVRRRRAALLVAGTLVVAGVLRQPHGPADEPREISSVSYVVRDGDTLWSIATRISGEARDPRPLIQEIAETNHVSPGELVPGETLVIP